jgi:hypothetical protein
VIGFVSQFFFIDIGRPQLDEHARPHSSCATTAGLARDDSCLEPKRTDGCHLAVSGMTIRILRAKESLLTGATGQERQPGSGEFNIS